MHPLLTQALRWEVSTQSPQTPSQNTHPKEQEFRCWSLALWVQILALLFEWLCGFGQSHIPSCLCFPISKMGALRGFAF